MTSRGRARKGRSLRAVAAHDAVLQTHPPRSDDTGIAVARHVQAGDRHLVAFDGDLPVGIGGEILRGDRALAGPARPHGDAALRVRARLGSAPPGEGSISRDLLSV